LYLWIWFKIDELRKVMGFAVKSRVLRPEGLKDKKGPPLLVGD
jgi:hypothetical protein